MHVLSRIDKFNNLIDSNLPNLNKDSLLQSMSSKYYKT